MSTEGSLALLHDLRCWGWRRRTQWVAAGKLRLLRVFAGELVADAVEELDVALLGVLLHCVDKRPGHGSCGLGGDCGISPAVYVSRCIHNELKRFQI